MIRAERIASAQNVLLKRIRRAARTTGMTEEGFLVAEGFHLVEEVFRSRRPLEAIVCTEAALGRVREMAGGRSGFRLVVVPSAVMNGLAATETNQGVIALAAVAEWRPGDLWGRQALVLALDGIQDPGNAGTMLRTAEAFGASGVAFLKGSVSPYNPKAVRASAGSVFRVPLQTGWTAQELLTESAARGAKVYAASASGALLADAADLVGPCVLVVGSEGRGVSSEFRRESSIRIPVTGVESLNAAVAAAILLYEARRQRGGVG
ncbi:MAG: TrmH family RNA methyltransferase [Bryobacteraceae bacterium]